MWNWKIWLLFHRMNLRKAFEADEYSDTLKEELERYAQLCSGKELTEEERAERAELKIKFKNLSTDLSGAAREKFEDIERRRETND